MRLRKLLVGVEIKKEIGFRNINIQSITHRSSDVTKGGLFIAINGRSSDGNDYIEDAINRGAKCIITEREMACQNATIIVVKNARKAMSIIAKNFYNRECDNMDIVGVVGTSGKTTTSHIIKQILEQNGKKVGVIGTNGVYIDNIRLDNGFTTPDPIDLHYIFYQMKSFGVDTVVMEISAQGISQFKVAGIRLKVCVFTNLTPEHLDFFGSMDEYANCKMKYFDIKNMDEAIINVDDPYGMEIAYTSNMPVLSVGIENPANTFAIDILSNSNGLKFVVNLMDDVYRIDTKLVGRFNVYNIMSAMAVAKILGLNKSQIERGVQTLKPIDGRYEVFHLDKGKSIIVDFAHTIDSIDRLLSFVKSGAKGRVIALFGCVGYSDSAKRKAMMNATLKCADYVVVTSDNPGNTPFEDIEKDMVDGVPKNKYISIEDRKSAINFGYGLLRENDTLVVMGKGVESFQKIGNEKIPYSDIKTVQELINKQEVL